MLLLTHLLLGMFQFYESASAKNADLPIHAKKLCAPKFTTEKFNDAIKTLNKINSNQAGKTCTKPEPENASDVELRKKLILTAVKGREKDTLASYAMMSYLYGSHQGRNLDDAHFTSTLRQELCQMTLDAGRDQVQQIRRENPKDKNAQKLIGIIDSKYSCVSNPEVSKRIDQAIQVAHKNLKANKYTPKIKGDLAALNTTATKLQEACKPYQD
jgi:hypothetical protein